MRLRTPSPPPDLAPARTATGPDAAPRDLAARRRSATWRSRVVRGGIAAGVVGVLALATWVVGYSDLLTADEVRVEGIEGPLVETVEEAAAVPPGVPLARVDTAAVVEAVEAIPDVASASASPGWPSTLVVTVEPRVAVASLAGDEGWYRVDADGVLFAPDAEPAADLPVLVAPAQDRGADARAAGVAVADSLPADLAAAVERIEATSPLDVRLALRDGRGVVWGSPEASERKVEVLTVLLTTPATTYDVSVPDRPTLRPVPATS